MAVTPLFGPGGRNGTHRKHRLGFPFSQRSKLVSAGEGGGGFSPAPSTEKSPPYDSKRAGLAPPALEFLGPWDKPFFKTPKGDDLVKGQQIDGFVKSSRCKARKNRGVRRTYRCGTTTKLKCNAADGLFTRPSRVTSFFPGSFPPQWIPRSLPGSGPRCSGRWGRAPSGIFRRRFLWPPSYRKPS